MLRLDVDKNNHAANARHSRSGSMTLVNYTTERGKADDTVALVLHQRHDRYPEDGQ